MAKGFDELVEFLLSEIALCGVQGAGSADFRRFTREFYLEDASPSTIGQHASHLFTQGFFEKVWDWTRNHEDVRILYRNEPRDLTLTAFEDLESQESGTDNANLSPERRVCTTTDDSPKIHEKRANTLASRDNFRARLRQQLMAEGLNVNEIIAAQPTEQPNPKHLSSPPHEADPVEYSLPHSDAPESPQLPTSNESGSEKHTLAEDSRSTGEDYSRLRHGREHGYGTTRKGISTKKPIFDNIPSSIAGPRIYVSQNRTWQAVAGHPIDLAKVPGMQFTLLSIIAAKGADGILQPELTKLSGQDKRSVPGRTDELAEGGYIEKTPVQAGTVRTSLLVHKRFVREGHFLKGSANIEDVFRNRTVILTGFVRVLYKLFQDDETDYIPMRDLRRRLGIALQDWNKRAMRSAILRLEETGMIQRKRALKTGPNRESLVVIKLLRPPQEEDLKNFAFRRNPVVTEAPEGILEEDEDGDELMRDIDLDLEFDDDNDEDSERVPPQWSSDRLLSNIMFDAIDLGGINGVDSAIVRDRTMGKFWKRPSESFLARLTDNWELSQRPFLRHLAIIRDTTVTDEKRRIHYVYRTHENFSKAVDDGQVAWEPVSREAQTAASVSKNGKSKKGPDEVILNQWGFPNINSNKFHGRGSSSLTECRVTFARRRPQNNLQSQSAFSAPKVEFRKRGRPKTSLSKTSLSENIASEELNPEGSLAKKSLPLNNTLLTQAQRIALGLPPRGRLGIFIEEQIRNHRKRTGDPGSIPEVLHRDDKKTAKLRQLERTKLNQRNRAKLFTLEFRRAHGLALTGKLPQSTIDHYRSELGEAEASLTPQGEVSNDENDFGIHDPNDPLTPLAFSGEMDVSDREVSVPNAETSQHFSQEQAAPSTGLKRTAGEELQQAPKRLRMFNNASPAISPSISTPYAANTPATPMTEFPVPREDNLGQTSNDNISSMTASQPTEPALSGRRPLNADMRVVLDRFLGRSAPGLYLNPLANWPMPRGRPKKAFLAVFKSDQLKEFDWFKPDPDQPKTILSEEPLTPKNKHKPQPGPSQRSRPIKSCRAILQPSSAPTTSLPQVLTEEANMDEFVVGEAAPQNPTPDESDSAHTQSDVCMETERGVSSRIPSEAVDLGKSAQSPEHPIYSLPGRLHASSKTINISARSSNEPQLEPYRSPYSVLPPAVSPTPIPDNVKAATGDAGTLKTPTPTLGDIEASVGDPGACKPPTPARAPGSRETSRPSDNERDVSESQSAATPSGRRSLGNLNRRGVVLGRGNMFSLRNQIVLDILELCGGVFPSHGEINAPFYSLWDQRAPKNYRKPDRSTLSSTLKNIVDNPENNIRMITFSMSTLDGQGTIERSVLAYKDIEPSDERIRTVQYGMTKAHPRKFWPEAIRHLIPLENREEPSYRPPTPELDESIVVENFIPPASKKIDDRVRLAMRKRHKAELQKRRNDEESRAARNNEVESDLIGQHGINQKGVRPRRARLETLNVAVRPRIGFSDFLSPHGDVDDGAESESSLDEPLARNRHGHSRSLSLDSSSSSTELEVDSRQFSVDVSSASESSSDTPNAGPDLGTDLDTGLHIDNGFVNLTASNFEQKRHDSLRMLTDPRVLFYPTNGTFSTDFCLAVDFDHLSPNSSDGTKTSPSHLPLEHVGMEYTFIFEPHPEKGRKRVRFAEDGAGPKNRRRISKSKPHSDGEHQDGADEAPPLKRTLASGSRGKFKQREAPSVVKRLTGLTGDPSDPIYVAPKKKRGTSKKPWTPMKPPQERKEPRLRKSVRPTQPTDTFKKRFCTLVIASCMSGKEGVVDWNIVANVHGSDPNFRLEAFKKLWSWIEEHMAGQLKSLTDNFQTSYLQAYENGQVDRLEDPETHDWGGVVRWALQNCDYPDVPLTFSGSSVQTFVIDELPHNVFDRQDWVERRLASVTRAQRILKYAYGAPLHTEPAKPKVDDSLLARSWIRSNIATPEHLYISTQAEKKLQPLGEKLLSRVVHEMVDNRNIRQRKLKRLLPGRNYNFTAIFAMDFRRTFELDTFMDAVELKKRLDTVFAHEDPEQRIFTISRTANDGTVMALLTLLNDGRIRMIPKLPPVNNSFTAPLPRLSVWGFSEGEYAHRAIDRNRMFWNVDVVPTSTYKFGNPLEPSPSAETVKVAGWRKTRNPPLPGKNDPKVPLPIWSSIDGRHVTWPWWYRILNLVIQALMFQPGASSAEIFSQCPPGTAELFEVELVLEWLLTNNAVRRHGNGTFEVKPGFWAAFGEELIGEEDDWFGEHVKRTKTPIVNQAWRHQFNLRSARVNSILQNPMNHQRDEDKEMNEDEYDMEENDAGQYPSAKRPVGRPYRDQAFARRSAAELGRSSDGGDSSPPGQTETTMTTKTLPHGNQGNEDAEMADMETQHNEGTQVGSGVGDPIGSEDVDAEGELDDEML